MTAPTWFQSLPNEDRRALYTRITDYIADHPRSTPLAILSATIVPGITRANPADIWESQAPFDKARRSGYLWILRSACTRSRRQINDMTVISLPSGCRVCLKDSTADEVEAYGNFADRTRRMVAIKRARSV